MRREVRRDARGRVTRVVYTVFEVDEVDPADAPLPDSPDPHEPDQSPPVPAKPTLPSNQGTKEPVNPVTTTTTTEEPCKQEACGGGEMLQFPRQPSSPERTEAMRRLQRLPSDPAQQVLDELSGRMQANAIRGSPFAYLRALIERADARDFTPEAGLPIAEARRRRQFAESALERAQASVPTLPPPNEGDPLVQRLNETRTRQRVSREATGLGEAPVRKERR